MVGSPLPAPLLRAIGTVAAMHLRLATPDDGPACAAIYAPYVTDSAISFELTAPDGAEIADRIKRTIERTPWVVVEVDGVVRGYAYAGRFRDRPAYDWAAETTVYVDRAFQGRGLGRAAMRAVLAILRLQGFHVAVAGVTPPNEGSVGLHRRLGFKRVGLFEEVGWKDGAWHGVDFFALPLSSSVPVPVPLPIVPLPDLVGSAELGRALAEAAPGAC
jgi:L-amino acid N-acyltransferase YncA